MGQFEHTLIIAEEGSEVHYIEGCSAPKYSAFNLHSGGVEVFVGEDAHVQYSTVQNWSKNTYNLNTKRAIAEKGGRMEWISGSMGSKATMLYPSTILKGRGASDNHITIAFAGEGQDIDTGAKVYHNAPNTKSTVESKSIAKDGGRTNYRGLVHIADGAENSSTAVECDALMFDNKSTSDTMPYMEINESKVDVAHEDRREDRRRGHLLPAVARSRRRRRQTDDRFGLHRAHHGGAAHRVRRRAQPARRAGDGGLARIT